MVTKKTLMDELEEDNIDYSIFGDEIQLAKMNKRHAFIESIAGKPMILSYTYSGIFDKEIIEFRVPEAIERFYNNIMIELGNGKLITLGKWWLGHSNRRQYNAIIFDPSKSREYQYGENYKAYNLWEGFNCGSKNGCWKQTKKHIWKVLCNKNKQKFKYMIKWFAWMVQNPGERAEVAIVLKGKEGAGKGFIFTQFIDIFGKHSMHISNRDHLTGKFNGHLRALVFLFADEAYYPGDKEVEGTLKQLITEPTLTIESKFKEPISDKNRLHVCMATNNEWVIPASQDSRRYFINEVDNMYAKNQCPNKIRDDYFIKIWGEMNNGGKEAMLFDLLKMNLKGWHPRNNVPATEELSKQSIMSLSRTHKALLSMIEEGIFPGENINNSDCVIDSKTLWEYFEELEPGTIKISTRAKAEIIKEIGVRKMHKSNGNYWIFPPLNECRTNWIRRFGKVEWEGVAEWQIRKSAY